MGLQAAEGAIDCYRVAHCEIIQHRPRQAIEEAQQSKMDPVEIAVIRCEEWIRGTAHDNGNVR
jgi:hypothetical protein